jgi:hypothetical protein
MFAAQGVHTIKGVEIYKGKPIFYGLSKFVFQAGIMARAKGTLLITPPGAPAAANAASRLRCGGRQWGSRG